VIGCDADICNKYIFEGKLITSGIPSYNVKISNVKGGNSGVEIERSNKSAIMLLAKIIQELQKEDDVLICSFLGGKSEGDISTSCECIIKTEIIDIENKIKEKCLEDNIHLQVDKAQIEKSFSVDDSKKIVDEIINLKQGLIENKNNIITSGNVGIIKTEKNKVFIEGILRSLEEDDLHNQNIENYIISKNNDFAVEEIYQDSAWVPNINSKLKNDYANIYYKLNGKYPEFEITHGGLECSCIAKRIPELDIISIGSIIEGCHTVNEKMYISSCEKTIKILLAYLEYDNN
jgi:dipeptidase D